MADCWEDLLVDGQPLADLGWIVNAEGLLSTGRRKGDLLELDWVDGAVWQQGPRGSFSFDVPLVLNSTYQDVALGKLRRIQAWQGGTHQLIRRLTIDGEQIEEMCSATMIAAPQIAWDFRQRQKIMVVMVWQCLSGYWTQVV